MSSQALRSNNTKKFLAKTLVMNAGPHKNRKKVKIHDNTNKQYNGLDYITPWQINLDSPQKEANSRNDSNIFVSKNSLNKQQLQYEQCIKKYFSQLQKLHREGMSIKYDEGMKERFFGQNKEKSNILRTMTEPHYQAKYNENIGFGPLFYHKNRELTSTELISSGKVTKGRGNIHGEVKIFQRKVKESRKMAVVDLNQTTKEFYEFQSRYSKQKKTDGRSRSNNKQYSQDKYIKKFYNQLNNPEPIRKCSLFNYKNSIRQHKSSQHSDKNILSQSYHSKYPTKIRIKTTMSSSGTTYGHLC